MRARTDDATSQTAAQVNRIRTGTRQDASISAGAMGGFTRPLGGVDGQDGGIALIKKGSQSLSGTGGPFSHGMRSKSASAKNWPESGARTHPEALTGVVRVWRCTVFFALSSPEGGEAGERRLHRRVVLGLPPPRPSPRSYHAGRGSQTSSTFWFMVPSHGKKAERAFHEPRFPNPNDE